MEIIIASIIGGFISLVIMFYVIEGAVKSALFTHYKVVRRFETTGEWNTVTSGWKVSPNDAAAVTPDGIKKPGQGRKGSIFED
jgi:hypothetical protein